MEALSVREYRNNLAASFTKADNGEQVLIRRKNEIYALVKVGREDLMITPELQARIDKAREEIKSGKCVTLKSSEDIKILRKLFYFYLFHCYFYLCFPHREVRQAMLFMKIIIQSLLLSFQLHNLSKCRNNHIDLPFFCLSSKYLRRIMKWLV